MRKKFLVFPLVTVVFVGGILTWLAWPDTARLDIAAVSGWRPQITPPRGQVIPTVKVADAIGWQRGAMPIPAAGLAVQPFATGLDHPRWLYRLPNGDVLVAETNSPPRTGGGVTGWVMGKLMAKAGAGGPSPNRITLLRDTNGDGIAETRSVLLTGLNSPTGMLLQGKWLYVANTDSLVRYPFTIGETKITAKPELIVKLSGGGNHWARNVIAAPDGKTLYVSVGSSTNIGDNGLDKEAYRANILQVYPEAKTYRIFAAGLRNPNGMAIEPHSGQLWAVVNERDMMGSDLAPDYMSQIEFGDNFGWPWYYWGGYPDSRIPDEDKNPALQEYSKRPDYALGPHTASLGLAFSFDARLGGSFTNGAFIGQHGSWNRKPVSGYKVVFVPFGTDGFPVRGGKPIDVLTGFLNKDGDAQGRPVGVITDQTGALLVADDVGNIVWRVAAKK